jgi:hypothetical protein
MGTGWDLRTASDLTAATDRDCLEEALRWAAQRQLKNFYRQAGDEDERRYPALARIVRTLVGDQAWHDSPTTALISAMRTAISHPGLPERMTGRRDDEPAERVNTARAWHGAPERQMAAVLYGFRDDLVPLRNQQPGEHLRYTYDDYLLAAFQADDLSKLETRDKRRVTKVIRQDLAAVLLQMEQDAIEAQRQTLACSAGPEPADLIPTFVSSRDYIPRPDYEAQLTEHRLAGTRIFLLHGDAGTGKTTLARHFGQACSAAAAAHTDVANTQAGQAAPADLVEIDARTPAALIEDVAVALDSHGIDSNLRDGVVKKRFRDLLASDTAPAAVLLDNIEEATWAEVQDLIPEAPQSVVIITSRVRFKAPDGALLLPVGEMTDDEAADMVRAQLLDVSVEDAAALADDIGNRPLAIRHACGFLAEEAMPVAEFRRLLRKESTAPVLDTIVIDELTLTAIYRLTISRLEPDTLRLLDLIASVGGRYASHDFLRAAWQGDGLFSLAREQDSLDGMTFRAALRRLEGRCLVEVWDYYGDRTVAMHALTTDLIAWLRTDSCAAIHRKLLAAAEAPAVLQDWQAGKTLPLRLASQTPDLRFLLSRFVRMSAVIEGEYPHIARIAAFVVHGAAQHFPDAGDRLTMARRVFEQYQLIMLREFRLRRPGMARLVHNDVAAPHPRVRSDAEYPRRQEDMSALHFALLYFLSLFARNREAYEISNAYDGSSVIPPETYLQHGLEQHPFRKNVMYPFRGSSFFMQAGKPEPGYKARLRIEGLRNRHERRFFEAGSKFFALGTAYFDEANYTGALRSYKHAHEIWSSEPRECAGERCKAAVRVADTYYRMGKQNDAEDWKRRAIADVRRHLETHGLEEWTADPGVNFFIVKAMHDYPPAFPAALEAFDLDDEDEEPSEDTVEEWASAVAWWTEVFGEVGGRLVHLIEKVRNPEDVYEPEMARILAHEEAGWDARGAIQRLRGQWEPTKAWELERIKVFLSVVKIAMYVDETEQTKSLGTETLQDVVAAAETCRDQLCSPYWFADALLTAYVLVVRYGYGNEADAHQLFPKLQVALSKAKRRDRLDIAWAARDLPEPAENYKGTVFNPLWLLAE